MNEKLINKYCEIIHSSTIIQDGKLVGAVTYVMVNDPTRVNMIYIENMLDAAE